MRIFLTGLLAGAVCFAAGLGDLEKMRDQQDRAGLEKSATALEAGAEKKPADANGWYEAATARSYLAEVAFEQHDKPASEHAAEAGIKDTEKAIDDNGKS